jgi:hypothetical protein
VNTLVFRGEVKGDPESAVESAAEVALRYLCDEYGFHLDDFNYSAYIESRETLLVAQEYNRKLGALLEAMQDRAIRKKQQLDKLVKDVKEVCLNFADVLPVRAAGPSGVEYVGPPSPPAGGYDKLALDLVQLLQ